ncbi:hypothetical protein SBA3_3530008 [Candidatus Sulfopaludibacter sp. SbA3]|nr:hypothetical protein SBA3_3530008 [Candidatus Sulfopaludibacter sp. SbA3]
MRRCGTEGARRLYRYVGRPQTRAPWGTGSGQPLAAAADQGRRDLLFMRQQDTAVIASTEPLTGPVIYEFRLAHR